MDLIEQLRGRRFISWASGLRGSHTIESVVTNDRGEPLYLVSDEGTILVWANIDRIEIP